MNKETFSLSSKQILIMNECLILSACLLICFFCRLSFSDGVFYFLYQLLGILIPGLAFVILLKVRTDDCISLILFSFISGLLIQLLEYLFLMLTGLSSVSLILYLIIAAASVFVIWKNKDSYNKKQDLGTVLFCTLLICFLLVICFFAVSWHTISPAVYGGTVYNKDFLFWVGNSISFTKGLPVQEFRLYGYSFHYHFFSSILMAEASIVTGIDAMTLCYCFSYLIPCFLLVYSSYYFLIALLREKIYIWIGMIFILLADGSVCYLPEHLYYCPFGFDYGYILAMVSIAFLIRIYQNDEFTVKNLFLSCVLIALDTGFKGPLGLVALSGFGINAFALLFSRRWKQGLIFGSFWLMSFLFVYLVFIIDLHPGMETVNDLEFLGPLRAFDVNRWAIGILNELIELRGYPNNGITRIFALALYIYRCHKAGVCLLILSVFSLIYLLLRRKNVFVLFVLICIASFGILLTVITHQDGNSQIYFIMASFPFAVMAGLYGFEQVFTARSLRVIAVLLVLALSFGDYRSFLFNSVKGQVDEAFLIQKGNQIVGDKRYYFTKDEYELALWLKENTLSKDLIALDCFEYDGYRKEEMLGVFSERFIWNDGQYSNENEKNRRRKLVEEVMALDAVSLKQLKEEGVSYLIQTFSQYPKDLKVDSKTVYETDAFRVYSLREQ